MPYMKVNGCDLFYTEWGDPEGRPVVLVHAFGLSSQMWSQQVPDLIEAGLRCITYDRRGHGRSDWPGSGYDLDTLAGDLAGVIEHLGVEDAIVVGHSMGASEVVRYVTLHGTRRVAGIVLSAPTVPGLLQTADNPGGVPPTAFEEAQVAMRSDIGAWMGGTSNQDYFGRAYPMEEDLGIWTRQQIAGTPLPVLLACQRSFFEADLGPELRLIDRPTLILQGDADTSCPLELTGRPSAALVRDSRIVVIEGAGHGLYASAAGRYNEALLGFASGCRSARLDAEQKREPVGSLSEPEV